MSERASSTDASTGSPARATGDRAGVWIRAIKVAVAVFGIALGAVGIAAWLSGDPEELPFDYEGFD